MTARSRRLESYAGKRILVTGAAGYVGRVLLEALGDASCLVTAVSRAGEPAAVKSSGPAQIHWLEGDVTLPYFWQQAVLGQDIIFHLAGQTSNVEANADPVSDWTVNVSPILHFARACETLGIKPRIVFASTATVVGMVKNCPVGEDVLPRPFTVYEVHKLAAETYLEFYWRHASIPTVSLRLANVYGPSPAQSRPDRGILNRMARAALSGSPLQVFGSGEWLRDYLHVSDVVAAFMDVGTASEEKVAGRVFNLSSGIGTPFVEVVRGIADAASEKTGKSVDLQFVGAPQLTPIDVRNYFGDNRELVRATGWKPQIELHQGIREMIEAFLNED